MLISYVLGPLVDTLARRGLSRWIGAALVIVLLCGTLAYSTYKLAPQFIAIVDEVPNATRRLAERTRIARRSEDESAIEKMQRAASEIDKVAAAASDPAPTQRGVTRVQVVEPAFRATEYLWAGGRNALAFLGQSAMVLFLVFFLLVTGDLFKRKLVKIAGPTLTKKKITVQIMDDINKQISGFLRVQVVTSALVGVLTGLTLWYFGVRQAVVWGLFAGIFNSIPYLGPLIVTGGLGAVTFMQFDDCEDHLHLRHHPCHHQPRRLAAHADADGPGRADEPGRDLRGAAVLELGLGRLGRDPRGADDDDGQGDLRPGGRPAGGWGVVGGVWTLTEKFTREAISTATTPAGPPA